MDNEDGQGAKDAGIQELLAFLGRYSSGARFEKLKRLDQENEELRKEVIDLRTTNEKNLDEFIRRREEWKTETENLEGQIKDTENQRQEELMNRKAAEEALVTERSEKESLNDDIREQEKSILRLVEKMKKDEAEIMRLEELGKEQIEALERAGQDHAKLQGELQTTREELEAKINELTLADEGLAFFRTLLVQLLPLEKMKTQIRDALDAMFNCAWDYFQRTLGQDIETSVLLRSSSQAIVLKGYNMPFPPSNTSIAKGMRVVAGLMTYAKALTTHVFRPTYITQNHELDGVLSLAAVENSQQAACVRAVLLKALPERQKKNQDEGVNQVVKEVSDAVGHWVQEREVFEAELKEVCERAAEAWSKIQVIEERIWPDSHFEVPEEWQVLPLAASTPEADPAEQETQDEDGDNSNTRTLSNIDVARVVWPTFLAADPQGPDETGPPDLELVCPGYVLTQKQLKLAEEESSETFQRAPPRAPTWRKRRNSAFCVATGADET
ncbi:hypothetical protein NOR_07566 [Metarhizium rileyi]|uniref:MEI5 protein n=1 Tax=Metarhizium rileyi (strain RCEF 4871) TaxID=1649241 RepID=A0A166Y3F4_METRR|nr:hypothetical protein NOR_07566 [Metarhizium rileyi RCEF 4871]